jgi:NAD(P)-dependent dehydrogenase (short-subunit alcohol dehydrogenase family)
MIVTMQDKVCLITGATSGIGRATAVELGRLGATLILVGRNQRQGSQVRDTIGQRAGRAPVEFLPADLSRQQDVRQLAATIARKYARLDVLINNAGAKFSRYEESADGIELTLATNHLGHFLLTLLLWETLQQAPAARVVTVSSGAHHGVSNEIQATWPAEAYNRKVAYSQSKLANVMFTYELARRLHGTQATANALDPGGVATNLGRNNGLLAWAKHLLFYTLKGQLLSPRQGADTVVYLASAPEVAGVSGQFFHQRKPTRSSPASYDEPASSRLWELSLQLAHLDSDPSRPGRGH